MLVIIPPCDGNEGCYCDDNFFDNEIQSECDLALWIWDDEPQACTMVRLMGPATYMPLVASMKSASKSVELPPMAQGVEPMVGMDVRAFPNPSDGVATVRAVVN